MVGVPNEIADIRYVSRFSAWDPVIYLHHRNRRQLVVPRLEFNKAKHVARGIIVRSMEELPVRRGAKPALDERAVALLRESGIKSVTVSRQFPMGIARRLERSGIRVIVARHSLFPERETKTTLEIKNIRQTQAAAVKAMRAAVHIIAGSRADERGYLRHGRGKLSAEMVRTAINMELQKHNSTSEAAIIACGRRAADPHCRGWGPLRGNECIVIDIFPRNFIHGYHGDLSRTIVKGKAPPAIRKMHAAVKAAQAAALAAVRPGAGVAAVHKAAQEEFKARGFWNRVSGGRAEGFVHNTGHGLGLEIHESPGISNGQGRLKAGNVITIEPGLYYGGIGGVRIEDVVEVTQSGWRYLASCGKALEV